MSTEPRSLREIIARASFAAPEPGDCPDPNAPKWKDAQVTTQELYLAEADAALKALRSALAANPELIEELIGRASDAETPTDDEAFEKEIIDTRELALHRLGESRLGGPR